MAASIINILLFVMLGYMLNQVFMQGDDKFLIPLVIVAFACTISLIALLSHT